MRRGRKSPLVQLVVIILAIIFLPKIYQAVMMNRVERIAERRTEAAQSAIQSIAQNQQLRLQELQRKQAEQAELAHQRRFAEEQAKLEEIERQRRVKKLSSSECQFWKHYYDTKGTERGLEKVREFCYE